MKLLLRMVLLTACIHGALAEDSKPPLRLAIVGLAHDHINSFIPKLRGRQEFVLVGIVESNTAMAKGRLQRLGLSENLLYASMDELFSHTNAQVVAAFSGTMDHRPIVEECARRHVDVMMEKPMAPNFADAQAMAAAARKADIRVLVNYQTTWFPANQSAYEMIHNQHTIGEIRRILAYDGHSGPKEIGCSATFLDWLTDPNKAGGALLDFGCYGADLATWLLDGARPTSVLAVTQHIKPQVYPKVEDDATIVVTYPKAVAILQASWNWPFDRKDLEVYGNEGYVMATHEKQVRMRKPGAEETQINVEAAPTGEGTDEISYLAAVVRREVQPSGLASLDVNLTVMEILDAARRSAESGRRVDFP